MDNIELYREMRGILRDGCYAWNNYRCCLKLQPEERSAAVYLSPRRVAELVAEEPAKVTYFDGRGTYFTHNEDSFAAAQGIMAWERYKQDLIYGWDDERIRPGRVLVLNFANPVRPGGGVRYGARAQEEDLCRKSTLLASLESEEAAPFYVGPPGRGAPGIGRHPVLPQCGGVPG